MVSDNKTVQIVVLITAQSTTYEQKDSTKFLFLNTLGENLLTSLLLCNKEMLFTRA